ncbi:hypothetical protein BaRGS_00002175 [Batillaria attramentaria]|uniref:Uncharacterized protein n=1 Tax=Batillaria attramentaria TaxID=370345 RepID=A0ABD0M5A5_9CAEN
MVPTVGTAGLQVFEDLEPEAREGLLANHERERRPGEGWLGRRTERWFALTAAFCVYSEFEDVSLIIRLIIVFFKRNMARRHPAVGGIMVPAKEIHVLVEHRPDCWLRKS